MAYVLISLVAGLAAVERKGFLQAMLSRPIALAPVVGWALGDVSGGLLLAPVLELLWLGAVKLGASTPDHEALGTAAVVGGAVLSARALSSPVTLPIACLAMVVAVPAALLGRTGERAVEAWNERIATRAEAELSVHHLRLAVLCNLYGLGLSFLVSALLAPTAAALAALLIPGLLRAAPGAAMPLAVGFFALGAAACAAAAKSLRARAAPASYFAAAAATAGLGLMGVLAGRAL